MYEYNNFYDYPAQVEYQYVGDKETYKGIAYGEVIIDLSSGETIYIGDEIDITHVASSWSPYFLD